MAPTTTTKSLSFFFFLLLLSHALFLAKAQQQRQIKGCSPFSCGQLQGISYPFRRRDDPPQCGDPRYQLNCQGNKSTFFIGSVEYLVNDTYYDESNWPFSQIKLVDPNFVGGGSCALPSQSLSPDTLRRLGEWWDRGRWSYFMNCSQQINQNGTRYLPVSCHSSRNSSSFVYVFIADEYELLYLHPSCEFISIIPIDYQYYGEDIFKSLKEGFFLSLSQQSQIEGCVPFSCGQWHNISYPFRKRDDPPKCGDALYQLNCQGNKATFSIGSIDYLVTQINNDLNNWRIRLVDPNFVGGGSCALPSQSLSLDTLNSMGVWWDSSPWASFMNCSEPIKQNDSGYWPVSCLSSHNNSSFVYVFITDIGYELHPSCELVSMIPVDWNSNEDVFSILQKGFFVDLSHQRQTESCPPLSCGQFHNITSYSLPERGSQSQCRDVPVQLNCQGNKATFSIGFTNYLVTKIYNDYYSWNLRIVDPNFVGGGTCACPSQSLSPATLVSYGHWKSFGPWACFINCSQPIKHKDHGYWPLSCLNSRYTSSFVYVFINVDEEGCQLRYLHPSCEFISMIPVTSFYAPGMIPNSTAKIFSILQQGFDIEQHHRNSITFRDCLKEYRFYKVRMSGFEACMQEHFNFTVPALTIAIVLISIQSVPILIALIIIARLIIAPIMIWLLVLYRLWSIKQQEKIDSVEKFLRHQQTFMATRYAYTDIIAITRHFKEKLGQGGFGSVFKGELAGGILVAVKMMGSSKCNGDEFINEVSTIGRIHHLNVVRLVGYCSEGSKRALVYEYMPGGSLDKYIFSNKNKTNLHTFTSEKLINMALGVARGINYLHYGCDMQILHFDIKPHNILLDDNFTPKISDFGLARLYPKDKSLVSISATRGTIGYIAPELISRSFGVISKKSDVYSYGMLLMEMAGRRRNVDSLAENSSQVYYPSWIYDKLHCHQEGVVLENNFEISELEKKLAIVGLWCIQMKSFDRPTMTKVIEMLESDVETIPMPPKPFLSSIESIKENKICLDSFSTELSIVSE